MKSKASQKYKLLWYLYIRHLEQKESKYCCQRKWNIKTVGAKGRQIFFSGKAKQNIVGAKERRIFFSGRAKQNKVGGKEWLGCLAFAPTLKQSET